MYKFTSLFYLRYKFKQYLISNQMTQMVKNYKVTIFQILIFIDMFIFTSLGLTLLSD